MAGMTIAQRVAEAAEQLRGMSRAELTEWGREHGMDNRSAFSRFKRALLEIGIDYAAMRIARPKATIETAAELVLFSDAKASAGRFAICAENGEPLWFGRFFDDRDFNGEQSSGELAAAKKAVWLASKIGEAAGVGIALTLKVDAKWLLWANNVGTDRDDHRGGKARQLGESALRLGVALTVEHVPGTENPADEFTVCSGFQKWSDNDLASLARKPAPAAPAA